MLIQSYLAGLAVCLFLVSCLGWKDEKKRIFKIRAGIRVEPYSSRNLLRLRNAVNLTNISVSIESFVAVLLVSHIIGAGTGIVLGYGDMVAAALSFAFPGTIIGSLAVKTKRRQKLLNNQIEPLLISLSGSLYGNPAIIPAIQEASNTADQPMKKELDRVLNELEHGIEIRRALTNLTKRTNSEVLALAVSGIIICRDTGGNMSKMLEALVEIARTKSILQGKVHAMTAQQKATATLVTTIPLLFIICAQGTNSAYKEYFMTPLGIIVIAYSVFSVVLGFVWLKKMTSTLLETDKC